MNVVTVQELLDSRSDCSSDLASFANGGNGLSTPADPQSDHLTSVSCAHRIALLSVFEISHTLKQLSALFQS